MRHAFRPAVLAFALTTAYPALGAPARVTARLRVRTPGTINEAKRDRTTAVLMDRLTAISGTEPYLAWVGPREIRLTLTAGPTETAASLRAAIRRLTQPGKLEFIWLKDVQAMGAGSPKARYLYEGGSTIRDIRTNRTLSPEQVRRKILYADPKAHVVSNRDLQPGSAKVDLQPWNGGSRVIVMLKLNEAGTRKMFAFTRSHIGALLAIVQDGRIMEAPRVKDPIADGAIAIETANGTVPEAQELANTLNAGILPVDLEVVSISEQ